MSFSVIAAGSLAFGVIIGWYVYYVNRYRRGDVQFSDLTTLVGIIGGSAVLSLFKTPDLFGWYGIGLALGFFGYFFVLLVLVALSANFDADWFLDGRRKNPPTGYGYGTDARDTVSAMREQAAVTTQNFFLGEKDSVDHTARLATELTDADTAAARVRQACDTHINDWEGDCSGFAKAVCKELGAPLQGDANGIVDFLDAASGWTVIGNDATAGAAAAKMADENLVIGARKGNPNGHVVVVVKGQAHIGKYPIAFWGKLNDPDNAGKGKSVNWAWDPQSRDSVKYAYRSV